MPRPYLCATLCVTKDPETGVRNMGTYRGQLKRRIAWVCAWHRGWAARAATPIGSNIRRLKKPMPVAIVIGCAPAIFFTGPQKLAIDCDEMGVAGALLGEPVKCVRCITNDLEVPADSEIVIEGVIDETCSSRKGRLANPTGMSRSKITTCRCRSPRSR